MTTPIGFSAFTEYYDELKKAKNTFESNVGDLKTIQHILLEEPLTYASGVLQDAAHKAKNLMLYPRTVAIINGIAKLQITIEDSIDTISREMSTKKNINVYWSEKLPQKQAAEMLNDSISIDHVFRKFSI